MTSNIIVRATNRRPVHLLDVEIVERKGLGHPDHIADSIAEAVSRRLSQYYMKELGLVLHHNVDKVLVVGGQSNPRFGGGEVIEPIRIIVAGRATTTIRVGNEVKKVPIGSLILDAARSWIRESFRFLDPDKHVIVDYKIGQGSVDLVGVYEKGIRSGKVLANDTSVGVAFAPLTPTERLVLETEMMINSREFKRKLPEVGEDVKVMALRVKNRIELTIAAAMVSHLIRDKDHYVSVKEELKRAVEDYASKRLPEYEVSVKVNVADDVERNIYYITVTGTSAEHGDDGATGRGNRANGLITPMRPMSMEATAGKNPVSHVGKIYNVVAYDIAKRVHQEVKYVEEVYVYLLSQIGSPVDSPRMVYVDLTCDKELSSNVVNEVNSIVAESLNNIHKVTQSIIEGRAQLF